MPPWLLCVFAVAAVVVATGLGWWGARSQWKFFNAASRAEAVPVHGPTATRASDDHTAQNESTTLHSKAGAGPVAPTKKGRSMPPELQGKSAEEIVEYCLGRIRPLEEKYAALEDEVLTKHPLLAQRETLEIHDVRSSIPDALRDAYDAYLAAHGKDVEALLKLRGKQSAGALLELLKQPQMKEAVADLIANAGLGETCMNLAGGQSSGAVISVEDWEARLDFLNRENERDLRTGIQKLRLPPEAVQAMSIEERGRLQNYLAQLYYLSFYSGDVEATAAELKKWTDLLLYQASLGHTLRPEVLEYVNTLTRFKLSKVL